MFRLPPRIDTPYPPFAPSLSPLTLSTVADFRTHVTFSSAIGAGYAVVASGMGFDLSTALVGGGLCGVSGMLPDVDSDSGVPRRESLGFAAAIVPMLLLGRFRDMGLEHDQMILLAAATYFGIRFVAADLIGRWSVHRGMWHSIPAILIFAGLAFLISSPTDVFDRYLKAIAVALGSFSHLLLDEIYSVDTRGVVPKLKKSFGTAIKFWGKNGWANFSTYAKLAAVSAAILTDQMVLDRIELRNPELAATLRDATSQVQETKDRLAQRPDTMRTDPTITEPSTTPLPSHERPSNSSGRTPDQAWAGRGRSGPSQPVVSPSPWFSPPGANSGGEFAPNRSDPATSPRYTR